MTEKKSTKHIIRHPTEHKKQLHLDDKRHAKPAIRHDKKVLETKRVPAIQTSNLRGVKHDSKNSSMGSITNVSQVLPVESKVLSHRQRKFAKKRFPKTKQTPNGTYLQYRLRSSVDAEVEPTDRLKAEWMFLDLKAEEMFKKKYDNLTKNQQSRLIESLHKDDVDGRQSRIS